jgi:MarR family transcriptional regulator, multiple antibiotic resistance protein MarR
MSTRDVSSSTTPRPRPFLRVRQVHRLAHAYADRLAREHGLTMQQWELVVRLQRAGGTCDQRELCCLFGVTPPTLSALIDAAEQRGWIERLPYPGDRRRRRISLTEAGEELAGRVPHVGREVGRRMTAGFTPEERTQLADLLERAALNLAEDA